MSLLDDLFEDYVFIDETTEPDGRGGFVTVYKEGATFQAAISKDDTTEARIAEKNGFTAKYTIMTPRSTVLPFNKIIKRKSDGYYFQITDDDVDSATPQSAGLDLRYAEAERWQKPKGAANG